MPLSLAARLIIPLVAAAGLVIAGGLYIDYRLARARVLDNLEQRAAAAVASGLEGIAVLRDDVRDMLEAAGDSNGELPMEPALRAYLDALRIDRSGFGFLLGPSGLLIGAPQGTLIAAPLESVLRLQDGAGPWPRDLAKGGATLSVERAVHCPGTVEGCRVRLLRSDQGSWAAGLVYSETAALQPLQEYETRVGIVGAAMLILLAVATSLITRRLIRPLRQLAQASEGIARGELDRPLPPTPARGNDEVGQLLIAFERMRRELGELIERIRNEATLRSRIDGELSAAREIQMAMLPEQGSASIRGEFIDLWARLRPARAVGGDLYSFHRYRERLLFCIGDVSDKGVPAALFMARAMSLIQQWEVQPATVPPHIALQQLNEALCRDNERCMFLTLTLGVIDKQTLELQYACAGHDAPLLLRDRGRSALPQGRGPALGLEPGLSFPLNCAPLYPGDRLLLRTDGFDEARSNDDEMLGETRFLALLKEGDCVSLDAFGEALFSNVDRFIGDAPQFDDMALLLLDVHGQRSAPLQASQISLRVDATLLRRANAWLRDEWQKLGLWPAGVNDLQLVLEEILCNVRDHSGCKEDAALTLSIERYADRVELECADPGVAYDPFTEARRAELGRDSLQTEIGGLGLHLITRLTDAQFYRREGGRNILRVRRGPHDVVKPGSGVPTKGAPPWR